jgi:hypothetical protein
VAPRERSVPGPDGEKTISTKTQYYAVACWTSSHRGRWLAPGGPHMMPAMDGRVTGHHEDLGRPSALEERIEVAQISHSLSTLTFDPSEQVEEDSCT